VACKENLQLMKSLEDARRKQKEQDDFEREEGNRREALEEEIGSLRCSLDRGESERRTAPESVRTSEGERYRTRILPDQPSCENRPGEYDSQAECGTLADVHRDRLQQQQQQVSGCDLSRKSRYPEAFAKYAQGAAHAGDEKRSSALAKARAKIRKQNKYINRFLHERKQLIEELECLKCGLEYAQLKPQHN
jgi:hypothetical protein